MALQGKPEGGMDVDAQATEKCALNCEALDLALDEIIKSQNEKRATATAGRNPQAKKASGQQGVRNGVAAKAKGGRLRQALFPSQEGRSLLKPRLSVAGRIMKKRGVPRTTRGITQDAKLKNSGGRVQAATNRVFVGQGDSYVLVAKPNITGRNAMPRPVMRRRSRGIAKMNGYTSRVVGNKDRYPSQFLKRNVQNPGQKRSFQKMGSQSVPMGVIAPVFKTRNAVGRVGFNKSAVQRGSMASSRGHQFGSPGNQFANGLYEPPHRRIAGNGGGNRSYNDHRPGVDFGWKKSGRFAGNRSFGNQGGRVMGAGGTRFGAKGRRGFRNSF